MRNWLILLGGLLLWAVHFFAVYGIGEFAGDGTGPRIWVLAITLAFLLAGGALYPRLRALPVPDAYAGWRKTSALLGLGMGMIGIVYQSLPALLS